MEDCLFCKIIKGEIPCYKIYEDKYTLAFLDISNDGVGGHTLVLPKIHTQNIISANQFVLSKVMSTVKKISRHYIDHCGFDGVNVFNNCNECAGQSVMHLHFHIIPRKNNDGVNKWDINTVHSMTLEEVCKKLAINNDKNA